MKSIFWHNLWKECGSPNNGYVSDIRKNTRREYHNAITFAKNNEQKFIKDTIATSLLESNPKSFWSHIRKIDKRNKLITDNIDGRTGMDACNVFKDKYNQLYNENHCCMDEILTQFNNSVKNECTNNVGNNSYHLHEITSFMVKK